MAPITIYDATVDVFVRGIETLIHILQKAKEHAPEESASYPSARLYEDMLPLSRQVQIASDASKNFVKRALPQREIPVWEDNEATMDELIARAEKTLALLKTVTPEDLAGLDDKSIELKLGPNTVTTSGKGMSFAYSVPNFNFHVVMTYAILRMKGVPLGKMDYLKPFTAGYLQFPGKQ